MADHILVTAPQADAIGIAVAERFFRSIGVESDSAHDFALLAHDRFAATFVEHTNGWIQGEGFRLFINSFKLFEEYAHAQVGHPISLEDAVPLYRLFLGTQFLPGSAFLYSGYEGMEGVYPLSGSYPLLLSGIRLVNADMTGAALPHAFLDGADLRGSDFHGAVLTGTHLEGADLREADFGGAELRGAVIDDVTRISAEEIERFRSADAIVFERETPVAEEVVEVAWRSKRFAGFADALAVLPADDPVLNALLLAEELPPLMGGLFCCDPEIVAPASPTTATTPRPRGVSMH